MIARTWRGWVRTEQAAAYVEYITRTGLSAYQQTPGNQGAQMWTTDLGDGRTEVMTVSWWSSRTDIEGFAGQNIEVAVFYPKMTTTPSTARPPSPTTRSHGQCDGLAGKSSRLGARQGGIPAIHLVVADLDAVVTEFGGRGCLDLQGSGTVAQRPVRGDLAVLALTAGAVLPGQGRGPEDLGVDYRRSLGMPRLRRGVQVLVQVLVHCRHARSGGDPCAPAVGGPAAALRDSRAVPT